MPGCVLGTNVKCGSYYEPPSKKFSWSSLGEIHIHRPVPDLWTHARGWLGGALEVSVGQLLR